MSWLVFDWHSLGRWLIWLLSGWKTKTGQSWSSPSALRHRVGVWPSMETTREQFQLPLSRQLLITTARTSHPRKGLQDGANVCTGKPCLNFTPTHPHIHMPTYTHTHTHTPVAVRWRALLYSIHASYYTGKHCPHLARKAHPSPHAPTHPHPQTHHAFILGPMQGTGDL